MSRRFLAVLVALTTCAPELAPAPVALAVGVAGCTPRPPVLPPPPDDAAGCVAACDRLRELECDFATTPDGRPCEEFCGAAQQNGVNFGTTCISLATSCADAEDC